MIPSFHAMISSFHAVFVLRQRDKSAKVIDYNNQVIRVREYLIFLGIPSLMFFLLSLFPTEPPARWAEFYFITNSRVPPSMIC